MVKFNSLNDGTRGFRFRIGNTEGICRKRGRENARCLNGKLFGITKGKTTNGVHFGKFSLYIEKRKPKRSFWNLTAA